MFENSLLAYIFAETPIHPGSGTAISGVVDLPIQRERHTEFPMIQGSSLKGVFRNSAKDLHVNYIDEIFGSENSIGGISVTDAKILAFPVRTLKGVFGWVTSPLVLDRYKRDLKFAGIDVSWDIPVPEKANKTFVQNNSTLLVDNNVYVEELELEAEKIDLQNIVKDILKGLPDSGFDYLKEKLERDLIIISDDIFRDLVLLTTEVAARIKINPETGNVETGALWYQEFLPTDTLMYSLILIPNRTNKLTFQVIKNEINKFQETTLQIGGDETLGKGFVKIKLIGG